MRLAQLLATACLAAGGCYQGPAADLACKLRCTDHCPEGMTCVSGVCVGPGGSCGPGLDASSDATMPTCGTVGQTCCAGAAACGDNAFCTGGTCQQCVTQVAFGFHHACAVKHDGTVWCAGENDFGEAGSDMLNSTQSTALQISDATGPIVDATAVAAGGASDHATSCAVRTGGSVWCWGAGAQGALGNNAYSNSARAVRVVNSSLAPLTNIVEIGIGAYHACGRDANGGMWCWGNNANGRLGDGTYTGRATAAPVQNSSGAPFTGVNQLAVGRAHTCAIANGSQLWCWGINDTGRIGDGTFTERTRPVMVGTATSVGAGRSHTCASHADGTASCWGDGFKYRLGDGTNGIDSPSPKKVLDAIGGSPLQGVASVIAAGVSCARMTDGRVKCWGGNTHGQAGVNAALTPNDIVDRANRPLTDVDRLVAGWAHVCAFTKTGALLCWGRNIDGEFGDGTAGTNFGVPTPLGITCP